MQQPSFQNQLDASIEILTGLNQHAALIEQIAARVRDTILQGHLLLTCGNGGSATDAQHLAEELVGRYRGNRRALPAVSLASDVSAITCIANDFGYDAIFARQLQGLSKPGDVLVCFSTSGNSPNIIAALHAAREHGVFSIALLGKDGGIARTLADLALVVAANDSARIQEAHLQVLHYICEVIEQAVIAEPGSAH
jgi:D-sedoheptulose 7-phosphate isomerase